MKIVFIALLLTLSSWVSAQSPADKPLTEIKQVNVNDGSVVPAVSAPTKPAAVVPKTPNSVAVTDLSIKQDVREFFYDEKLDTKSNLQTSNTAVPVADGRAVQVPNVNAQTEGSYSKQYGTKRIVSYSELRGLNADIKAALLRAGYKVVQAAPNVARDNEDDNFFNLKKRISNGDFHDAEYVLHGTVVSVDSRSMQDPVQGTSDYAYKLENSIIVEFTLVNTETMQVTAAFNAMGIGQDLYLGKANANYVPNVHRITKDLLSSFSQDSQKKLLDQLPPLNKDEGILSKVFSGSKDASATGDPATLKVYTPSKASGKPAAEVKDPVTIYKK
jgi:hypothetical protein